MEISYEGVKYSFTVLRQAPDAFMLSINGQVRKGLPGLPLCVFLACFGGGLCFVVDGFGLFRCAVPLFCRLGEGWPRVLRIAARCFQRKEGGGCYTAVGRVLYSARCCRWRQPRWLVKSMLHDCGGEEENGRSIQQPVFFALHCRSSP